MADKTYIGIGGGAWETGANWDPNGKPGSSDNVILTSAVIPAAPVGAESIVNLTAAAAFNAFTLGATSNLTITGTFSMPGGPLVSGIKWGAAAIVQFTGTDTATLDTNGDETGPASIIASADLWIMAGFEGSGHDLSATEITCGGNCLITSDPRQAGGITSIAGTVITGSFTAGNVLLVIGATGTPVVTGFEPLYKQQSGTVQSSRGASDVITVPDPSTVADYADPYGDPDEPITGTLATDGLGGSLTNSIGN